MIPPATIAAMDLIEGALTGVAIFAFAMLTVCVACVAGMVWVLAAAIFASLKGISKKRD